MIIARSPLRITLGGGGTDLPSYYRDHEGFLIAAAIDKYVYVNVMRPFTPGIYLKYSELEHVEQIVDIAVNGIRVADHMTLKQAKGNILEIKLPRGPKIAGEPVLIEFRSLDAISPKDAGLAPDGRKLGIGLISMQFAR